MLEVKERCSADDVIGNISEVLTLDHQQRKKGRLKVTSQSGTVIGLFLGRGNTLQVNDVLRSNCGRFIRVDGSLESVVTAYTSDRLQLSRVCYHLGNRHATIQVSEHWVRFKPDHVLEALVKRFSLTYQYENAVFEPEYGAYDVYEHDDN